MQSVSSTNPLKRTSRLSALLALCLAAGLLISSRPAPAQEQHIISIKASAAVDGVGNAKLTGTISFKPPSTYDLIKQMYPNLYSLFRDIVAGDRVNADVVQDTAHITANDANRTIEFSAFIRGWSVCRNGVWRMPLASGETLVDKNGTHVFTTLAGSTGIGYVLQGTGSYGLPLTARDIQVDTDTHTLRYRMPGAASGEKVKSSGSPDAELSVVSHKELVSTVYKLYADPSVLNGVMWAAKTVVRNTGTAPMYNVQISYKMGDYADASYPDPYTVVMPGGAVADCYYPILHESVAALKNRTPAEVFVKVTYEDAAGHTHTMDQSHLVDLLGAGQFLNSNLSTNDMTASFYDEHNNAPLLAAWVTKNDDPVRQFAGYISEAAGGVAAASGGKQALTWMKAAYDMELANNFVYQTPSGLSSTENYTLIQEVKLPREVLRAKAGTCIDLAILYATLCESTGLEARLVLLDDHCFPEINVGGVGWVPVECTGIGGGDQRFSFQQALDYAAKKDLQRVANEPHIYIDVDKMQQDGHIVCPELPTLPSSFLTDCGIHRMGYVEGGGGQQQPQQPQQPGNPPPNITSFTPNPDSNVKDFGGDWKGVMSNSAGGNWNLELLVNQDGDKADGSVDFNGVPNLHGTFKKAPVEGGNGITIHVRLLGPGVVYSGTLSGRRTGDVIKGDGVLVLRGQFNIPLNTFNVSWQARYTGGH